MPRFRKKPVVIEAFQIKPLGEIPKWFIDAMKAGIVRQHPSDKGVHVSGENPVIIKTLEGDHQGNPGDWIVKGIKGELYPVRNDIFEATYEPVDS